MLKTNQEAEGKYLKMVEATKTLALPKEKPKPTNAYKSLASLKINLKILKRWGLSYYTRDSLHSLIFGWMDG